MCIDARAWRLRAKRTRSSAGVQRTEGTLFNLAHKVTSSRPIQSTIVVNKIQRPRIELV
jgi:hypothetical protein